MTEVPEFIARAIEAQGKTSVDDVAGMLHEATYEPVEIEEVLAVQEALPVEEASDVYRPNDDEAAAALVVAKRRNTLNGGGTNLPTGETADEAKRLNQHYTACLAEIAVSRLLNLAWTGCGKGAAGLRDVGGTVEVRSIIETRRGLLLRPKDDPEPPYVLVYVDQATRNCHALGWAYGSDVRARGRLLDGETSKPCWILGQDGLSEFDHLKASL